MFTFSLNVAEQAFIGVNLKLVPRQSPVSCSIKQVFVAATISPTVAATIAPCIRPITCVTEIIACPYQATKLPKMATCNEVARNGNEVAVSGDKFGDYLSPFSATLSPGIDRSYSY